MGDRKIILSLSSGNILSGKLVVPHKVRGQALSLFPDSFLFFSIWVINAAWIFSLFFPTRSFLESRAGAVTQSQHTGTTALIPCESSLKKLH